jgi:hypothetical protein
VGAEREEVGSRPGSFVSAPLVLAAGLAPEAAVAERFAPCAWRSSLAIATEPLRSAGLIGEDPEIGSLQG